MVLENTDGPGTDARAKDGWGVLSRLSVYMESVREELEQEMKLATDPMTKMVEMEKLLLITKVQRFLNHELTIERQKLINTLTQDIKQ